ncbi:TIGR03503 family protein [Shewanella sp. SR44-3]|uniref:TIGR03503 family protein n=1 Tax=unclassified Shewanella TaxID=196818 RepID=UPI0015FC6E28|nr:TIGR03503 family protein [Shewanella sp. SR44-3]MBB1267973.1 TIGR03503 family protein [Shewanella sp. SR44-3]
MSLSLSYCRSAFIVLLLGAVFFSTYAHAEPVPYTSASELKNRFRIDHMVDELTLLVQRKYGSAPVVIVLPDGSKWYSTRHPEEVKWVDGITGDMIQIKKPMPGPWQLLGNVIEGSSIQKISKLDIEVAQIPQPLFQGERLKVTAKMLGDDLLMRLPGLDFMLEWTVRLVSKHLPEDENFSAGSIIAGAYKDNGEGLDEAPDNAVFTSMINLNQPWGHYDYQVIARNAVFEREINYPIFLSPQPIKVNMLASDDPLSGVWQLELIVDDDLLKLEETHFEFELVGPAGLQLPILIDEVTQANTLYPLPTATVFGSYRVKGNVVSTTITGREIVLELPELFFNFIEPPEPPPSEAELAAVAAEIAKVAELKAKEDAIFWIVTVNVGLFLFGVIGFVVWRKKQALNKALAAAELRLMQEQETAEKKAVSQDNAEVDLNLPEES